MFWFLKVPVLWSQETSGSRNCDICKNSVYLFNEICVPSIPRNSKFRLNPFLSFNRFVNFIFCMIDCSLITMKILKTDRTIKYNNTFLIIRRNAPYMVGRQIFLDSFLLQISKFQFIYQELKKQWNSNNCSTSY